MLDFATTRFGFGIAGFVRADFEADFDELMKHEWSDQMLI